MTGIDHELSLSVADLPLAVNSCICSAQTLTLPCSFILCAAHLHFASRRIFTFTSQSGSRHIYIPITPLPCFFIASSTSVISHFPSNRSATYWHGSTKQNSQRSSSSLQMPRLFVPPNTAALPYFSQHTFFWFLSTSDRASSSSSFVTAGGRLVVEEEKSWSDSAYGERWVEHEILQKKI